jgi:hypothetical protein
MKPEITKITPETVNIYHDEYGFIGEANEYEFNDLRIQIMNNKVEGYYVLKGDVRYYINNEGRLADWAFFGLYEDQLRQLLKGEI